MYKISIYDFLYCDDKMSLICRFECVEVMLSASKNDLMPKGVLRGEVESFT